MNMDFEHDERKFPGWGPCVVYHIRDDFDFVGNDNNKLVSLKDILMKYWVK